MLATLPTKILKGFGYESNKLKNNKFSCIAILLLLKVQRIMFAKLSFIALLLIKTKKKKTKSLLLLCTSMRTNNQIKK
tara:strand:+ start:154961 stop:155194 length:234 start_codon:yes stop_codon:yes gene_type:complete